MIVQLTPVHMINTDFVVYAEILSGKEDTFMLLIYFDQRARSSDFSITFKTLLAAQEAQEMLLPRM